MLALLLAYLAYFIFSAAESDGHVASVVTFYQLAGQALAGQTMPALVSNVLPLFGFQLGRDSEQSSSSIHVCPFRGLSTLQKLGLNFLTPGVLFFLLLCVWLFKHILHKCDRCDSLCT
jgi:hypothetical protein